MTDKCEKAILRVIGSRMREGRLLCKLTINESAELLNLDARTLKNIEAGFDIHTLPLKYIKTASELFDVSCDFLFGFTDDWEQDPAICYEREMGVGLYRAQVERLSKIALDVAKQERKIEAMTNATKVMLEAVHVGPLGRTIQRVKSRVR
jgi:transcriptional regulator with XRE-family HTH domain